MTGGRRVTGIGHQRPPRRDHDGAGRRRSLRSSCHTRTTVSHAHGCAFSEYPPPPAVTDEAPLYVAVGVWVLLERGDTELIDGVRRSIDATMRRLPGFSDIGFILPPDTPFAEARALPGFIAVRGLTPTRLEVSYSDV
jgi:hypothetical protein